DVLPGGGLLLGLGDVERVRLHLLHTADAVPSGDPEAPSWRGEWVPIVSERDGFHGKFVHASTGTVGSWCEGFAPVECEYASLSAFF
ncbi:hypothetical protein G3I76_22655, partial [Streptomyces sp. SID11233]|nr:hypothetical protein [Streptomyces sp. SID11233]